MNELEKYISRFLGENVAIIPLEESLPFYISHTYDIQEMSICGQRICLLIRKGKEIPTPDLLYGQMYSVMRKTGLPVVFVFEDVVSYNIERMKQKGINFIILKKERVYTPFLGISLGKIPKTMPSQNEQFTPLAQLLLLYHLQKDLLNSFTIQQLSDKFEKPYYLVNWALQNLERLGLCNLIGGKNKQLRFVVKGKELWDQAQVFFQNPVMRTLFTDQIPDQTQVCISNINALSHYSMLNEERRQTYAIDKNEVKDLAIETNKHYGDNTIEVWRYNPQPLSEDGFVDKLSLCLLFKNDDDPRVQIELKRIIKEMLWLEE